MLPVARGEASTRRLIVLYSIGLVAFTVLPYLTATFGTLYLASALVLGGGFVALAGRLAARPSRRAALHLHLASLAYLALLFVAMAVDSLVGV
jgi:protoheme IX farnesyltransferase